MLSISRVPPIRTAIDTSAGRSMIVQLLERVRRRRRSRSRSRRAARPRSAAPWRDGSRVRRARPPRTAARASASLGCSTSAAVRSSRLQVDVAAAQREAVGLPHDRQADDLDGRSRSRTIRRITASCCASLRPKYARCGWTMLQSLSTTVVTPRKCAGRLAPSSRAVSPSTCDVGAVAVRVHLLHGRREDDVDALVLEQREVARLVARIAREVLVRARTAPG